MQKKTTDPLDALDRAFREIAPETSGNAAHAAPEDANREPLDVLRSLVANQEAQEKSPETEADDPGIVAAPAATVARSSASLPLDPLEALRRLESSLIPEKHGAPATPGNDKSTLGAADPLSALKDLEQKESNLWAQADPAFEAEEKPETLPPPPPLAEVPERPGPKGPSGPPSPESSNEDPARKIPTETQEPVERSRPAPPPITNDVRAGLKIASSRMDTTREQSVPSRSSGSEGKRGMRWPRRRQPEPETRPAVDPGVAARTAFYRARQELGEDASLDDIIKHACRDLDRPSQEILFEIQLKILLGKSI